MSTYYIQYSIKDDIKDTFVVVGQVVVVGVTTYISPSTVLGVNTVLMNLSIFILCHFILPLHYTSGGNIVLLSLLH